MDKIEFNINNTKYIFDSQSLSVFKSYVSDSESANRIYFKKNRLNKLMINVSNDCNGNCVYCYQRGGNYGKKREIMSIDTAIDICNRIPIRYESIEKVSFFGGEPLLNVKVIRYLVEELKKKFIINEFEITTNGTLFDDNILEFLVNNNFKIIISCDGPKLIHEKLRKGCDFETIMIWLKKLKLIDYKKIEINCTYTKVHRIFINKSDLYKFFEQLGFSYRITDAFGDGVDMIIENTIERRKQKIDDSLTILASKTMCLDIDKHISGLLEAIYFRKDLKFYCMDIVTGCSLFYDVNGIKRPCNGLLDYQNFKNVERVNAKDSSNCKKCWAIKLCQKCIAKKVIESECMKETQCIDKVLYEYALEKILRIYDHSQEQFQELFEQYFIKVG